MATPPTLVSAQNFSASTTNSTTPLTVSLTVSSGDVIVVAAGTWNTTATLSTPTGGGLTYTLRQSQTTSQAPGYLWTAVAASSQTFTLSVSGTSGGHWNGMILQFSGSTGVGNSAQSVQASTGTFSLTAASDNSAVALFDVDFNDPTSPAAPAWVTSSAGAFTQKIALPTGTGTVAYYGGLYANAGTAGAKTIGMSAPTGQAPTYLACEVQGSAAVAAAAPSAPRVVQRAARIRSAHF